MNGRHLVTACNVSNNATAFCNCGILPPGFSRILVSIPWIYASVDSLNLNMTTLLQHGGLNFTKVARHRLNPPARIVAITPSVLSIQATPARTLYLTTEKQLLLQQEVTCHFNQTITSSGRVRSNREVHCQVPTLPQGYFVVSLEASGLQSSNESVGFYLISPISALWPHRGRINALEKNTVQVHFDEDVVLPYAMEASTNDGGSRVNKTGSMFHFSLPPTRAQGMESLHGFAISALHPLHAVYGSPIHILRSPSPALKSCDPHIVSLTANTSITVVGERFYPTCKCIFSFGNESFTSETTFLNSTQAICTLSAIQLQSCGNALCFGSVRLVFYDNFETSRIPLTAGPKLAPSKISPANYFFARGPPNPYLVTMYGSNFTNSPNLRMRLGGATSRRSSAVSFVSSTQLTAAILPEQLFECNKSCAIFLSLNGNSYEKSTLTWDNLSRGIANVTGIVQQSVFQFGDSVLIEGTNLHALENVRCVINSEVDAFLQKQNTSHVQCRIPHLRAGSNALRIVGLTESGEDYLQTVGNISFRPAPLLSGASDISFFDSISHNMTLQGSYLDSSELACSFCNAALSECKNSTRFIALTSENGTCLVPDFVSESPMQLILHLVEGNTSSTAEMRSYPTLWPLPVLSFVSGTWISRETTTVLQFSGLYLQQPHQSANLSIRVFDNSSTCTSVDGNSASCTIVPRIKTNTSDFARERVYVKMTGTSWIATSIWLNIQPILNITQTIPYVISGHTSRYIYVQGSGFLQNSTAPLVSTLSDSLGNHIELTGTVANATTIRLDIPTLSSGRHYLKVSFGSNGYFKTAEVLVSHPAIETVYPISCLSDRNCSLNISMIGNEVSEASPKIVLDDGKIVSVINGTVVIPSTYVTQSRTRLRSVGPEGEASKHSYFISVSNAMQIYNLTFLRRGNAYLNYSFWRKSEQEPMSALLQGINFMPGKLVCIIDDVYQGEGKSLSHTLAHCNFSILASSQLLVGTHNVCISDERRSWLLDKPCINFEVIPLCKINAPAQQELSAETSSRVEVPVSYIPAGNITAFCFLKRNGTEEDSTRFAASLNYSSNLVFCQVEPLESGLYNLQLLLGDFCNQSMTLNVTERLPVKISSISPRWVTNFQSSREITIVGSNFVLPQKSGVVQRGLEISIGVSSPSVVCNVTFINTTTVVFEVPAKSGFTSEHIVIYGEFESGRNAFPPHALIRVETAYSKVKIFPQRISSGQNPTFILSVNGTSFRWLSLRCLIPQLSLSGRGVWRDETSFECNCGTITGSNGTMYNILGQIDDISLEFTVPSVEIVEYTLLSVSPSVGSRKGFAVTITGSNFSRALGVESATPWCENVESKARFAGNLLNDSAIECLLSSNASEKASFTVGISEHIHDITSNFTITFIEPFHLHSSDFFASRGRNISFVGENMQYVNYCVYNRTTIFPAMSSSTQVLCQVPQNQTEGLATIAIKSGVDGASSDQKLLLVREPTVFSAVYPTTVANSDILLSITGSGFLDAEVTACRGRWGGNEQKLLTTYVTSTFILCTIPRNLTILNSTTAISVASFWEKLSPAINVTAIDTAAISISIAKASTFASNAISNLTLQIQGLPYYLDSLRCKIGSSVFRVAAGHNASSIICLLSESSLAEGNHSVSLSIEGQVFFSKDSFPHIRVKDNAIIDSVSTRHVFSSGGEQVVIRGSGLWEEEAPTSCIFNKTIVVAASQFLRSDIRCMSPSFGQGNGTRRSVSLEVTSSRMSTTSVLEELHVLPAPMLSSFTSSNSHFWGIPTVVYFGGDYLRASGRTIYCQFSGHSGGHVVHSQLHATSDSDAFCTLPVLNVASGYNLSLSLSGRRENASSGSGLLLDLKTLSNIRTLKPSRIINDGTKNVAVTLFGRNFTFSSVFCSWGQSGPWISLVVQNASVAECPFNTSGRINATDYQLLLSPDASGASAVTTGLTVFLQRYPIFKLLRPQFVSSGPNATRLRFQGLDVDTGSSFQCLSRLQNGSNVQQSQLSPASNDFECILNFVQVGVYDIYLASLHSEFTIHVGAIRALSVAKNISIVPARIDESSMAIIYISGTSFEKTNRSYCRLGEGISEAVWHNASTLECETSWVSAQGNVSVYLSYDGNNWHQAPNLTFSFERPKLVTSVLPLGASVLGGIVVTVRGSALQSSNCYFGESASTIFTRVSSSVLYCKVPTYPIPERVTLSVRSGGNETFLQSLGFSYINAPTVSSITPFEGSRRTFSLTMLGNGFRNLENMKCILNGTIFESEILSNTEALCKVKQLNPYASNKPLPFPLSLCYDACLETFSTGKNFSLISYPTVSALLSSDSAPSVGGFDVILKGNFSSSASTLWCNFNSTMMKALSYNSTHAICSCPPSPAGLVSVGVHYYIEDDMNSFVTLQLVPTPVMTDIYPSFVVHGANESFQITGSNFSSESVCISEGMQLKTTFINSSALLCRLLSYDGMTVGSRTPLSLSYRTFRSGWNTIDVFSASRPILALRHEEKFSEQSESYQYVMQGSNLSSTIHAACKLPSGEAAAAEIVGKDWVTCTVSSSSVGTQQLLFALNSISYDNIAAVKTLSKLIGGPSIMLMRPTGSVLGVTNITIAGPDVHVEFSHNLQCRFISLENHILAGYTFGHVINASAFACEIRPQFAVGSVRVEASQNHENYHALGNYSYVLAPFTTYISPNPSLSSLSHVVTIHGMNFIAPFWCGSVRTGLSIATVLSATEVKCLLSSYPSAVDYSPDYIQVSVDGIFQSPQQAAVYWVRAPIVDALYPEAGSVGGNNDVVLRGRFLLADSQSEVSVSFGSTVVPGTYLGVTAIACVSPAAASEGQVVVSVLLNGIKDLARGYNFSYYQNPILTSVHPSHGYRKGGTLLTAIGSNFANSSFIGCIFQNKTIAVGTYISPTKLVCKSPPHANLENVTVGISLNRIEWSSSESLFEYVVEPFIYFVAPKLAEIGSFKTVTITGQNFREGMSCLQDGNSTDVTASTYSSGTEIICKFGPILGSQNQFLVSTLWLAVDGANFNSLASSLPMYREPFVQKVDPSIGHALISTAFVTGKFFVNTSSLRCHFGFISVNATFISDNLLSCAVPALVPGNYSVRVSFNLVDVSNTSAVMIIQPVPILTGLDSYLGSVRGSAEVRVFGKNFTDSSTLVTKLDQSVLLATFINSTTIKYVTVPHDKANVSVSLSINGVDYFTNSSISYNFVDYAVLSSVYPVLGSREGGTLLTVRGVGFHLQKSKIVFGSGLVPCVPLTAISSFKLLCTTPPWSGAASVVVKITVDGGVTYSNEYIQFSFHEPFNATTFWPPIFGTLGGTKVLVNGFGFFPTPNLGCKFGNQTVSGTFISSNLIVCVTKAFTSEGKLPVSASMNAVDFIAANDSLSAAMVSQNVVLLTATNTVQLEHGNLTSEVQGSNFVNTSLLSCKFGRISVPTTFVSSTTLRCTLPTMRFGTYNLSVSVNGQEFSELWNEAIVISVIGPCPIGSYCVGNNSFLCPKGYYCPFERLRSPIKCGPGSFQPSIGKSFCFNAPNGTYAPYYGMETALDCPKGRICNESAMYLPYHHCKQGYYCKPGTFSAIPSNSTGHPLLCPNGRYCAPSIGQAEIVDLDYDTPQQCLGGYYCLVGSDNPFGSSKCPPGYYCPQGEEPLLARAGYYAPGEGNSVDLPCLAGSYSSTTGRSNCTQCPIGHMCEKVASTAPVNCSAGWVCHTEGTSLPLERCPAGYFCRAGTTTSTPSSDPTSPQQCSAGFYCVSGVYQNVSVSGDILTPQPCTPGAYCLAGSDSPTGTGICPAGTYCPEGSVSPSYTAPGTYTPSSGFPLSLSCSPGRYMPSSNASTCLSCPPGRYCTASGLTEGILCPPGTYRSASDSITVGCLSCPEGTYNENTGGSVASVCLLCPAGTYCSSVGLSHKNQSSLCPEGYYCGPGTKAGEYLPCAAGYFCPYGTSNATQYDNPCPAGFICFAKTGYIGRFNVPCPTGYYCLNGTGTLPPLTKCPEGTNSVAQSTSLDDCKKEGNPILSTVTNQELLSLFSYADEFGEQITQLDNDGKTSFSAINSFEIVAHWEDINPKMEYSEHFSLVLSAEDGTEVTLPRRFYREVEKSPTDGIRQGIIFRGLVFDDMRYSAEIVIHHGSWLNYQSNFTQTLQFSRRLPNRAYLGEDLSFAIVMQKESVEVPLNRNPDVTSEGKDSITMNFAPTSSYYENTVDPFSDVFLQNEQFWEEISRQGVTASFLHVPFISQCDGYDNMLPLFLILEDHAECTLIPEESTVPLNPFAPWISPVGDVCDYQISCLYEEEITEGSILSRWYELDNGQTIFYITKDPVTKDQWKSRTSPTGYFSSIIGTDAAVSVLVSKPTGRQPGPIPRDVTFALSYYQETSTRKHIISAEMVYDSFSSADDGRDYQFRVSLKPLTYFELLNSFGFDYYLYFIIFIIIAVVALIFVMIFWIIHRLFTRIKRPPPFRVFTYFYYANVPAIKGTAMTSFFLLIPFSAIYVIFKLTQSLDNFPNNWVSLEAFVYTVFPIDIVCLRDIIVSTQDWDTLVSCSRAPEQYVEDPTGIEQARTGRIAIALIVTGLFAMLQSVVWLVPKDKLKAIREDFKVAKFNHAAWRRMHILSGAIFIFALCLYIVDISYSPWFNAYVYAYLLALVALDVIYSTFLEKYLGEDLLAAPVEVGFSMVVFAVTLGAADFAEFMSAFYLDLFASIFGRCYGETIIIPRTLQFLHWIRRKTAKEIKRSTSTAIRSLSKLSNRSSRSLKSVGDASNTSEAVEEIVVQPSPPVRGSFKAADDEDLASELIKELQDAGRSPARMLGNVKFVEDEESSSEGGTDKQDEDESKKDVGSAEEALLGDLKSFSTGTTAVLLSPPMIIFLSVWSEEIDIPTVYGIKQRDMIFYFAFACITVPTQMLLNLFINNVQELIHGWKLYDYLKDKRKVYVNRSISWISNGPLEEKDLDKSLRTLDRLAFSSQYYLMISLFSSGMAWIVWALQMIFRSQYDPFSDPIFIPLILVTTIGLLILRSMAYVLAKIFRVYRLKKRSREELLDEAAELGYDTSFGQKLTNSMSITTLDDLVRRRRRDTQDTYRHEVVRNNRGWLMRQFWGTDEEDEVDESVWNHDMTPLAREIAFKWLRRARANLLGTKYNSISSLVELEMQEHNAMSALSAQKIKSIFLIDDDIFYAQPDTLKVTDAFGMRRRSFQQSFTDLTEAEKANPCVQRCARKWLQRVRSSDRQPKSDYADVLATALDNFANGKISFDLEGLESSDETLSSGRSEEEGEDSLDDGAILELVRRNFEIPTYQHSQTHNGVSPFAPEEYAPLHFSAAALLEAVDGLEDDEGTSESTLDSPGRE